MECSSQKTLGAMFLSAKTIEEKSFENYFAKALITARWKNRREEFQCNRQLVISDHSATIRCRGKFGNVHRRNNGSHADAYSSDQARTYKQVETRSKGATNA